MIGAPKPFYLDLGTARVSEPLSLSGKYFKVIEASSDAATATVGFDTQVGSNNLYTLREGATIWGEFNKLFINNNSQPGQWMKILVADGDFELEYANDVNLAGTVAVEVANVSTPSKVVVAAVSSVVMPADASRKSGLVRNFHASNILYVSGQTPATTNDFPVNPGESYQHNSTGPLYGIASGAGTDVRVSAETKV